MLKNIVILTLFMFISCTVYSQSRRINSYQLGIWGAPGSQFTGSSSISGADYNKGYSMGIKFSALENKNGMTSVGLTVDNSNIGFEEKYSTPRRIYVWDHDMSGGNGSVTFKDEGASRSSRYTTANTSDSFEVGRLKNQIKLMCFNWEIYRHHRFDIKDRWLAVGIGFDMSLNTLVQKRQTLFDPSEAVVLKPYLYNPESFYQGRFTYGAGVGTRFSPSLELIYPVYIGNRFIISVNYNLRLTAAESPSQSFSETGGDPREYLNSRIISYKNNSLWPLHRFGVQFSVQKEARTWKERKGGRIIERVPKSE